MESKHLEMFEVKTSGFITKKPQTLDVYSICCIFALLIPSLYALSVGVVRGLLTPRCCLVHV